MFPPPRGCPLSVFPSECVLPQSPFLLLPHISAHISPLIGTPLPSYRHSSPLLSVLLSPLIGTPPEERIKAEEEAVLHEIMLEEEQVQREIDDKTRAAMVEEEKALMEEYQALQVMSGIWVQGIIEADFRKVKRLNY